MASRLTNFAAGPLWKPDKTPKKDPKRIKVETDYEWSKTRTAFLKGRADWRGYYQCELCGGFTEHPEVDHILTRGSRADLKHEHSNLRALCHKCHQRRHNQVQ